MTQKIFEHVVEGFRSGLALPFRGAAAQLDKMGYANVIPLTTIADSIEGLEDGIDKRLIDRWNKVVAIETDKAMIDSMTGKNIDKTNIAIETMAMRVEIIDTAREDMGYYGLTRHDAQERLIKEIENMQKTLYPGLAR